MTDFYELENYNINKFQLGWCNMTFYLDIILLENIVMNYIIILTTAMICKIEIKQGRIILSSILGAIYAIILYLINLKVYNSQITKILLSICMVYIAFRPKNIKTILKQLVIFYLTSFCFGGAAYYLLYGINPDLIKSVNGILVGTYPVKIAILGGILGFFILNISFRLIKNKLTKKDMIYQVAIFYQDKRVELKVMLDTGNLLTEPITNTPVLIVEATKLEEMIPPSILKNIEQILFNDSFEELDEEIRRRCSIIPFSSIGKNNGVMVGFRPDYIKIYTQDEEEIRERVIVGICNNKITRDGAYSGLMGLNLLNSQVSQENLHKVSL